MTKAETTTEPAVGSQVERPVRLSPLNLSGLLAEWRGNGKPAVTGKKRESAREMINWACPICRERFDEDEEKAAEECCQGKADDDENAACPVCKQSYINHREAANCCLWKDLDADTRYRMADAVEASSSWAAELGLPQS